MLSQILFIVALQRAGLCVASTPAEFELDEYLLNKFMDEINPYNMSLG